MIDGFFDSYDRWSPGLAKLVVVVVLIYSAYHGGRAHGRNLEKQEMAHANTMYNEMVACVQIREMVKEQMYYDKQAARLKRGGTQ